MSQIPLTQNDIIFALVGAVMLFAIYRLISAIVRMFITRTTVIRFHPHQFEHMRHNCFINFPIDFLNFNGATFHRGTPIRITTTRQATFEGHLIGTNKAEMVCIMTENSVIAQEIGSIHEIKEL